MFVDSAMEKTTIHELVDKMFKDIDNNSDDKVSLKEFSDWSHQNMAPGLVTWIWEIMPREKSFNTDVLSPKSANLSSPSKNIWKIPKYEHLEEFKFNEREVRELEKEYYKFSEADSLSYLNIDGFKQIFSSCGPFLESKLDLIFHCFDKDCDEKLSPEEFLLGVSSICHSSLEQSIEGML